MSPMTSYVGRIKTVEPFDVYQKYLAMKRHFTSDSYDYHKYNGKVKANQHSFDIRKDKYFFYKLSKQKHVEEFLLANFVDGDNDFWVGQMSDDKVNDVYENYRKRQQSLTYTFKSDLAKMKDDFDSNIIVPDNEHPYLLRLFQIGTRTFPKSFFKTLGKIIHMFESNLISGFLNGCCYICFYQKSRSL